MTLLTAYDLDRLVVEVAENVLSQELAEESVLLDLRSGDYYSLNEVGAETWHLLREHKRVGQVFQALQETFADVAEETLKQDLKAFLKELESDGLITIHEEAS